MPFLPVLSRNRISIEAPPEVGWGTATCYALEGEEAARLKGLPSETLHHLRTGIYPRNSCIDFVKLKTTFKFFSIDFQKTNVSIQAECKFYNKSRYQTKDNFLIASVGLCNDLNFFCF